MHSLNIATMTTTIETQEVKNNIDTMFNLFSTRKLETDLQGMPLIYALINLRYQHEIFEFIESVQHSYAVKQIDINRYHSFSTAYDAYKVIRNNQDNLDYLLQSKMLDYQEQKQRVETMVSKAYQHAALHPTFKEEALAYAGACYNYSLELSYSGILLFIIRLLRGQSIEFEQLKKEYFDTALQYQTISKNIVMEWV